MTNFLTLFLYWKVYKNRLESIEQRWFKLGSFDSFFVYSPLHVSLSPVLSMSSIPPSDRS